MSNLRTKIKLENKLSTILKSLKGASKVPETKPSFLDQDCNNIQKRLQSLILSCRQKWTYAIFWKLYFYPKIPPVLVLAWGDGYFQAEAKSNKPRTSSAEEQESRKRVLPEPADSKKALRELILAVGVPDEEIEEDFITEYPELFFVGSVFESFDVGDGDGLPGRTLHTSTAVWVTGAERLASLGCTRAYTAGGFGIQTMVYIPLVDGVLELGSSSLIFPYAEFDLLDRIRPLFRFKNNISILEIGTDLARSGSIAWPVQAGCESESSVGNRPMFQQGNSISQKDKEDGNTSNSESDDGYIEVFTQILRHGLGERTMGSLLHNSLDIPLFRP